MASTRKNSGAGHLGKLKGSCEVPPLCEKVKGLDLIRKEERLINYELNRTYVNTGENVAHPGFGTIRGIGHPCGLSERLPRG